MKEEEIENEEKVKSEEVQAIIDRMPTQWAKYVSFITGVLICLIIGSGFIIRYPDTVDGQISVTASVAPVRLVANTSGRLHLLEQNKSNLQEGDVIAYIESGADYRDILLLDSLLNQYTPAIESPNRHCAPDRHCVPDLQSPPAIESPNRHCGPDPQSPPAAVVFPFSITLGDITSAYNTFVKAKTEYERILNTDIYEIMRKTLSRQIITDQNVVVNMKKELTLKKQTVFGSAEQLEKDKTLLDIVAITEDEYEQKQQQHLSKEESYLNLKSNLLTKQSDISRNNLEIQRIQIEEKETTEKAISELTSATNHLINMVGLWKEKYLLSAPFNGELEYLGFWRENSYVTSGQELFSIIPGENDIVGEVMIPSVGAGKVEVGQTANVKISKFPYDEYGLLKGRVESISRISNRIETREGAVEAYQVIITFPDGFVTNFGKTLFLDFESKGTVEIITKPKRLIERLFDNLKTQTEK